MVLITDKKYSKNVRIPKNVAEYDELFDLEFCVGSEFNQTVSGTVEDLASGSNITYELDLSALVADLPDGEYNYKLMAGTTILSQGLLRIGKLKYEPKKMNNKAKTIIQYGE